MRESITLTTTHGDIYLDNELFEKNVRCEYKDDFYSNKSMEGFFDFREKFIDYRGLKSKNFRFSDKDGRTITGRLFGTSFETNYNTRFCKLNFRIDEFEQRLVYLEAPPKKLKMLFRIPFVTFLERHIGPSYGFDEEYIIKFDSKELVIKTNTVEIIFFEEVQFIEYKKPNSIMTPIICPKIEHKLDDDSDIDNLINDLQKLVDDTMMIISLTIFHRVASFGYNSSLFDVDNKLTETFNYKTSKITCGDEYLKEDYITRFRDFFTSENLSSLLHSLFSKDNEEQCKLKKLIFSFITLSEKGVVESNFLRAFVVLEGICNFLVKKNNISNIPQTSSSKTQALIELGMQLLDIDLGNKGFIKANNKDIWLIIDYRNNLVHSNFEEFNWEIIINEYYKMMLLNRRMLLKYLVPELELFPYPNSQYEQID